MALPETVVRKVGSMAMTLTERREKRAAQAASEARIRAEHEITKTVVASGKCPFCHAGVKRNNSLTGWWQCEQFGAEQFRKDSTKPPCSWQGFTGE